MVSGESSVRLWRGNISGYCCKAAKRLHLVSEYWNRHCHWCYLQNFHLEGKKSFPRRRLTRPTSFQIHHNIFHTWTTFLPTLKKRSIFIFITLPPIPPPTMLKSNGLNAKTLLSAKFHLRKLHPCSDSGSPASLCTNYLFLKLNNFWKEWGRWFNLNG